MLEGASSHRRIRADRHRNRSGYRSTARTASRPSRLFRLPAVNMTPAIGYAPFSGILNSQIKQTLDEGTR
jgi:hypothetical protein